MGKPQCCVPAQWIFGTRPSFVTVRNHARNIGTPNLKYSIVKMCTGRYWQGLEDGYNKSLINIKGLSGYAHPIILGRTRFFHTNMSLLSGNALVTGAGKRTETPGSALS